MPDISGIEIAKYISENYPDIKILVLSMHSNEEFITKALSCWSKWIFAKRYKHE